MKHKVLILNGPNLNMLGIREPEIYGSGSLSDVESACEQEAKVLSMSVICKQSNEEGKLVTWVQNAINDMDGLLINAGAYTHTSLALLDSLSAAQLPTIEIHMSNIHSREQFRHHSFVSLVASGMICGLGSYGYVLGLRAIHRILNTT